MIKKEFFKQVDGIDKYRAVKDDSGPLTIYRRKLIDALSKRANNPKGMYKSLLYFFGFIILLTSIYGFYVRQTNNYDVTLFYLLIGVGGVAYSFNTNFMIWVNRKKIAQDVIIDLLEEERQTEKSLDTIKKSKLELVECQQSGIDDMKQYYSKSISYNRLLKYVPEREFLKMWAEEFRPAKEKEYMKQEALLQNTLLSITKERHFLNQFV